MKRMWSKKEVERLANEEATQIIENAESGTISNILGLDNDGGLVKEARDSAVKPIYCHPITINGTNLKLTCLILNNSATPFTASSFVDWIDVLYTQINATVRIMISGGYKDNNVVYIASYMGYSESSQQYYLSGIATDGTAYTTNYDRADFLNLFSSLDDGVNRIN